MKKLVILITTLFALVAQSQTNEPPPVLSGPGWDAIKFLGTGSNWLTAPYGIYGSANKSWGAGIGVGYKINEIVVPTLRLDWFDHELWMPSASLQLQAPLKLLNKLTFIPFVFGGIATPIYGRHADNGTPVGIFGIGGAIRLDFLGQPKWWKPVDVIADCEKWSGFGGSFYRAGVVFQPWK